MGKKRRRKCALRFWCTARSWGGREPFVVIGNSLLQHPSFGKLKASSRVMYVAMALLAKGRCDFTFSRAQERRYCGMAPETALECKAELEENGFLTSQKQAYQKTQFAFNFAWHGKNNMGSGRTYTQPWLSAFIDGREERVLLVGVSLFECDQFQELSYNARELYLSMAMEAGPEKRFVFPPRVGKKYGIASTTLKRAEKELETRRFIEKDPKALLVPGAYQFCFDWKRTATIRGKLVNPPIVQQKDPSKTEQVSGEIVLKMNSLCASREETNPFLNNQ